MDVRLMVELDAKVIGDLLLRVAALEVCARAMPTESVESETRAARRRWPTRRFSLTPRIRRVKI